MGPLENLVKGRDGIDNRGFVQPRDLAAVSEFRIISVQGAPSWIGDALVGTLGVDNVFASTVPVELLEFTVE